MMILNIPNVLTFIRIIILPVFVTVLLYEKNDYALYLFIAAGLTDMLDGLFARLTGQKTKLGAFLDPLADKLLLITSFVIFSIYEWLPKWLAIVVISRDIIVILGWFLFYLVYNRTKVEPSLLGKIAIFSQIVLIAYTLFAINFGMQAPVEWMFFIVAFFTIFSGIQYVYLGLKQTNEK